MKLNTRRSESWLRRLVFLNIKIGGDGESLQGTQPGRTIHQKTTRQLDQVKTLSTSLTLPLAALEQPVYVI